MKNPRFMIALIVALITLGGYYVNRQQNPITGESQHVALSKDQEVALGLEAAPELAAQHGGRSRDAAAAARVEGVGQRLISRSVARGAGYRFAFHLLDDQETINAFALPGGQVFITEALLRRLGTEGQLGGVLGHEVGHVVARHGAEHLAKQQLIQGLGGAAVIASYDPNNPRSGSNAAIAMAIGQLIGMKFGRDDELESDRLGVRIMAEAGYDPRSMIRVMQVLAEAGRGRSRPPEFFSTHPNPDRRIDRIKEAIRQQFPGGVPQGLQP